MQAPKIKELTSSILKHFPKDWLTLTTHRLDIYNESKAKTEFLEELEKLIELDSISSASLSALPTAYDYIRLGHPLSSLMEWALAKIHHLNASQVICFSSQMMPLMSILRSNSLQGISTKIYYQTDLPKGFDEAVIKEIYGYSFTLHQVNNGIEIPKKEENSIFIQKEKSLQNISRSTDFHLTLLDDLGSILFISNAKKQYVKEVQHVRRRESIAMTPANCLTALNALDKELAIKKSSKEKNKGLVRQQISQITESTSLAAVGSSGLSVQYAIMMGLVHHAKEKHPGKPIHFIVPPNCYGGTNDQARRVAASIKEVSIIDLPVDAGNDMVKGVNQILDESAIANAVPYIIAEIPTNPRVEVPQLTELQETLKKQRTTQDGNVAVDAVFILDQTFCPNVHFLGKGKYLSEVKAISYASGSKFPSGGKCTAGYCVANDLAKDLMSKIEQHLLICDNEATDLQYAYLAEQLPSMNDRIKGAYSNTRSFVNYINEILPEAKINFVSEELAAQGFTPSVFSLDLPSFGNTPSEKEENKRKLNHQLINMMITQIPSESKYCVSYGQLKGCYWTIPATSTQGTTKEGDKDYIARVALSANMNLEKHKQVFEEFVKSI